MSHHLRENPLWQQQGQDTGKVGLLDPADSPSPWVPSCLLLQIGHPFLGDANSWSRQDHGDALLRVFAVQTLPDLLPAPAPPGSSPPPFAPPVVVYSIYIWLLMMSLTGQLGSWEELMHSLNSGVFFETPVAFGWLPTTCWLAAQFSFCCCWPTFACSLSGREFEELTQDHSDNTEQSQCSSPCLSGCQPHLFLPL